MKKMLSLLSLLMLFIVGMNAQESDVVIINSMQLYGTFPGLSWEQGLEMTNTPDEPAIWSLTLENVQVEGIQYFYKVSANGKWGEYELPAQGNQDFIFGTADYPAGTYNLTFTADTENHQLTLVVDKQSDVAEYLILTLDGRADITEGKALLIEATEEVSANVWIKKEAAGVRGIAKVPAKEIMEDGVAMLLIEDADLTAGQFSIYADKQFEIAKVTLLPNADAATGEQIYPVVVPANPFENVTIDPAEGEVASLREFTITFANAANAYGAYSAETDKPYVISADNTFIEYGEFDYGQDFNLVVVRLAAEVTTAGEYTLVIPAGTITADDQTNAEALEFKYTVKASEIKTYTVYVKNVPADFGAARPYAYVWSGEEPNVTKFAGDWPGQRMGLSEVDGDMGCVWQIDAAEAPQYIIFNNGNLDAMIQTSNLEFVNNKVYDLTELLAPAAPFDYEKIAIDPVDHSTVESLQNFTLTFGGQEVTVNAEVKPAIGDVTGEIALNADGSVAITFAEAIVAPGDYTLDVPEGAILYDGNAVNPLSFKYTIAGAADFTIDPAPGVVESLETFIVTFNYYIEAPDATAYLFNRESEEEIEARVYEGAGKTLTVMLPEAVTTPGEWQLNIEGVKKTADETPVELIFDYTIKSVEPDMSYYILGDFWGWEENPKQMEATDNESIYTLVIDFTAEAKKYEYKLRQGNNWDGYQLPASGNYDFEFGTDEYPAGDYTLTFTANISGEEIDGIPAYTVVLVVKKKTLTGIDAVNAAIANGAVIYNMRGVRVEKAYKGGLYIVNGKKVVVK